MPQLEGAVLLKWIINIVVVPLCHKQNPGRHSRLIISFHPRDSPYLTCKSQARVWLCRLSWAPLFTVTVTARFLSKKAC